MRTSVALIFEVKFSLISLISHFLTKRMCSGFGQLEDARRCAIEDAPRNCCFRSSALAATTCCQSLGSLGSGGWPSGGCAEPRCGRIFHFASETTFENCWCLPVCRALHDSAVDSPWDCSGTPAPRGACPTLGGIRGLVWHPVWQGLARQNRRFGNGLAGYNTGSGSTLRLPMRVWHRFGSNNRLATDSHFARSNLLVILPGRPCSTTTITPSRNRVSMAACSARLLHPSQSGCPTKTFGA